jgi:hypothetical protein
MSFQVTISNVPDKELGPLIARLNLPRGSKVEQKYTADFAGLLEGPNTKKRRMPASTKLTMTGATPQQGTKLLFALQAFEKLEGKHGIGSVSMEDLIRNLKTKKQNEKLAQRLLKAGFVDYLT